MSADPRTPGRVLHVCRAALARGPLFLHQTATSAGERTAPHWRFGRRLFSAATVRTLIDAGEAVRIDNRIEGTL